jgi:iron complex transport system substrate-binding protein
MSPAKRIVSFLPSATEITCALGLEDSLVGITHECDYPPQIQGKPVVVRNALPIERMSQSEIDVAVAERMKQGLSLYQIDEELLAKLAPDLILTQNLCQVCAPSGNEVSQVLKLLPCEPEILWLTPRTLNEIQQNVLELGAATDRMREAEQLVDSGRKRLQELSAITAKLERWPRVFCMEWLDPVYVSGHWVPEMVRIAGGVDDLGRLGVDSVRISWDEVLRWQPEVIVIMPCGFNLKQVVEQSTKLFIYPGWASLPAVQNNRVYAVDANAYFARPGPRVVEGAELLAHLFHPELFSWPESVVAYHRFKFSLVEDVDYYWEGAAMVFTAHYLRARGYCCESGCRHCPY